MLSHNPTAYKKENLTSFKNDLNSCKYIFSKAKIAFSIKDLKGTYIFVNSEYTRQIKIKGSSIEGKNDHDLFNKDVADLIQKNDSEILHQTTPQDFKEFFPTSNGTTLCTSHKFLLKSTEGTPIAVGSIIMSSPEIIENHKHQELRQILDHIPSKIWHKDDQNKILTLNKSAAQSMGMSVHEAEGADTFKLFPEMAKKYYEDDLKALKGQKPVLNIIEKYAPIGQTRNWVKTDKIPFIDSRGKNTLLVIAQDITDERESFLELDHLRNILDFTLNKISDGVLVLNSCGVVKYINQPFLNFVHKDKKEIKKDFTITNLLGDSSKYLQEKFLTFIKNKKESSLEFSIQNKNFQSYYILHKELLSNFSKNDTLWDQKDDLTILRLQDRTQSLTQAIYQKKLIDVALTQKSNLDIIFEKLVHLTAEYIKADAAAIIQTNLNNQRINVTYAEKLSRKNIIEIFLETIEEKTIHNPDITSDIQMPYVLIKSFRQENGNKGFIFFWKDPEKKENFGFFDALVVNNLQVRINSKSLQKRNLNRLKNSEEKLQKLVEELAQSNKDLEQFAFIVSHDLCSPLRAVDNLSNWIIEDIKEDPSNPEIEKNLQLLQKRIHRMENLLESVLSYARVGQSSVAKGYQDGYKMIYELVQFIDSPNGFKISLDSGLKNYSLPTSPLDRVFINFFSNAIKHHHKKIGVIKVSCKEIDKNKLLFIIRDNGPGIPEENQQKIFDMFHKLEKIEEKKGLGIGLAIVKKIISNFNEKVWVESSPKGSRFYFTWSHFKKI